ncbi:ATP-binding protein [Pseudorhodoferax sp.]|uniref:ATP-binding protein n=1 Tax=Pseudorhodoferax sp. TaxID=1993553 RepID=UPI002DD65937|nr:ATP-binding protein [Pseudorhodoferax sp.]
MLGRGRWGVWSLRSHLSVLLMLSMLLTLVLAGSAVLLWRIPRIERANQEALQHEVREMAARMEVLLGTRQARLELMASLLDGGSTLRPDALLDHGVGEGDVLGVVYRLSPQGRVAAVGLPPALRPRRADLLGSDLSSSSLYRALAERHGVAWSGRYLSVLSGQLTAGLALRTGSGEMLIAEVPFAMLLDTVETAAGADSSAIWVVDGAGEVIADTDGGRDIGKVNIRNAPLMRAVLQGDADARTFVFPDGELRVASAHSPALGWYFIGHVPVGLAHPDIRGLVLAVGAAFLACLAIGLLMAPFWASYLARPLQSIMARAARTLRGEPESSAWPVGPVAEYNRLARHLATMALAMRERELQFLAIFNASPVPMVVTDADRGYHLLHVNDAWCKALLYRREDVIGRTGAEVGVFSAAERQSLAAQMQDDSLCGNLTQRRANGELMRTRLFGQRVTVGGERWLIWASIDIDPMLRVAQQLRALNQQLEERVQQRTAALAQANADLSQTVAQLRAAQNELVRAEKMAALGSLVAGVAHELNTPLGNGVMAVSAMADATQGFQATMQAGVRRGALQQLVDSVAQGTDIAGRNLRRAAELVHSFKQVAVDQTSSQRRSFELAEVVHEMVVSLKPSFARKPWRIEVDVPASGLRMDSYPGALGQALGNLIQNAVLHGFDGRNHGTVRITAGRSADQRIWLHVVDNGRGIAAEHLNRIFDPFMTTKMGRGGTGLGLHISYNAVVNLLGGTLTVNSALGQGACFEMRLPDEAPRSADASAAELPWGAA